MKLKLVLVGAAMISMAGCLKTREELREADTRAKTQDQVLAMQRAEAKDTNNRMAEIESTIRELNGRIEIVENKSSEASKAGNKSQQALEEQLAENNKKVQLLQEEVTKLEGQVQSLTEQVVANANALAARPAEAHEDKNAKGDKKTPFDIGEEFFQKKDWKKAIVAYQKSRDQSPKGKNFLEATYKIGVCFQELGMKDEAKTFYEELIAKSPNSSEARRAKIRLKKLK